MIETLVLVHGRSDPPALWDPVACLLGNSVRIVRSDARGLDAVGGDGPVHVLVHGPAVVEVWQTLAQAG